MIPVTSMADPTTGTLIIHKYGMDSTSQAGSAGTGEVTTPSGTPLDGVTFKVYTVVVDSTTDSQGVYPDTSNGITITGYDGSTPTKITDSASPTPNTFNIVPVAANPDLSNTGITTANDPTNGDGSASTGVIPQGIYLVVEQTPPASLGVTTMSAPFVVAVPMAKTDGTGWIDPVNVYPKNETLAVTKTVDKSSVSVGDSVAYTITSGVPFDMTGVTGYTINDTLDPSLNFDTVGSLVANLPSGTMPVPTTDYSVSPTAPSTSGGAAVTITFNSDGIDFLTTNKVVSITSILNATVNSGIKASITATNTATASVTNGSGTMTSLPSDPVVIHTGTIEVTKEDATSGDTLSGATFKVASSLTNAQNNQFLQTDSSGNIIDVGDTNYGSGTDVSLTTAAGGIGSVSGLADIKSGSPANYWLVETTAPQGYNMLVTPVEVSFTSANESNNWTASITVKDTTGFTLPLTGAAGVALFTIMGVVLVGCAVILTVNMRKKRAAKAA